MARPKRTKVKKRKISKCCGKTSKYLTTENQVQHVPGCPLNVETNNSREKKCNQILKNSSKRGTSKKLHKEAEREQKIVGLAEKDLYSCKICGVGYESLLSLKKHQKVHTAKRHQCHVCGRHFRRKCFLEKHTVTHTDDNPYKCHFCGKMFKNKEQFRIHHRIHSGEKPYQCDICGKHFAQNGNLKNHKKIHAPENVFCCDICDKEFECNKDLLSHILTHDDGRILKCFECGKMFGRKDHFEKHKELHSENRPFSCDICGQSYKRNFELKCHLKLHSKDQGFICDYCGKKFSYKSSLNYHIRTHTGAKPYSCGICGKSFSTSSNRSKHVLSHSDFKPFKCCQCNKAFLVKSALIIHERTHTGSRPYQCAVCLKTFIVQAELNRHMKKVHRETGSVRTEITREQMGIQPDDPTHPCVYQKDPTLNMNIATVVQDSTASKNSQSTEADAIVRSLERGQNFQDPSEKVNQIDCFGNSLGLGNMNSDGHASAQNTTVRCYTDRSGTNPRNEQIVINQYIQDFSSSSSEQFIQAAKYGIPYAKLLPPYSHVTGFLANKDSILNSYEAEIRKDHFCKRYTAFPSQTPLLLSMENQTTSNGLHGHSNQISNETVVQNNTIELSFKSAENTCKFTVNQDENSPATSQYGVCNYLIGTNNRISEEFVKDIHTEHLNSISNTNNKEVYLATPDRFAQDLCEKVSDKDMGKTIQNPTSSCFSSGITGSGTIPSENRIKKTTCEDIDMTNPAIDNSYVSDADTTNDDGSREGFDKIIRCNIIDGKRGKEDITCDTVNKIENPDVIKKDNMVDLQLNEDIQNVSEHGAECRGEDESNIKNSHVSENLSTVSNKTRNKGNTNFCSKETRRKERFDSESFAFKVRSERTKEEKTLSSDEGIKTRTGKPERNKPIHTCESCGKTYDTKKSLQGHMKIHKPREHRCSVCKREFRRLACLKRHLKVHTEDNPYRCSYCSKDFSRQDKLKLHLRKHTGDKPYQCDKCGKHFSQYGNLLSHTKMHSPEKAFRCNECGSEFMDNKELLSHITCHGLRANKCKVCGKMFGRKEHLLAHMEIHTGERRYKCKVCDRGFLNANDCKSHEVTHTDDKEFACEYCGKRFHHKSGLVYHIRTHTGAKPYTCNICGKSFRTNSYLNKHAMFHSGFKPHKCEFCDKAFFIKKDLTVHRRIHTGERPFKCTVCDKSFREAIAMKKHLVFMHTCPTCGSTFREKNELKLHIASHQM